MYAHSAHIPQPPHTSGRPYQGLRTRIDPEQIPSPVDVAEYDQEVWSSKQFMTLPQSTVHIPLSTTAFSAIDQGNSSPRFIRPTTWNLPNSASLADACHIPLAAIIQPFAEEDPVPVVDCTSFAGGGPPRCAACRAYLNPWCEFIAGGSRWRCNLCKHETEVDADYFCPLDTTQRRTDILTRPELCKGTVDFVVGSAYNAPNPTSPLIPTYVSYDSAPTSSHLRDPVPRHTLFALDISQEAVTSNFLAASCTSILYALYGPDAVKCFPDGCTVGFITFDTSIHFYNLNPSKDQVEMLIVPDIEGEMFSPLPVEILFVDPFSSRNLIESFLVSLRERFHASSTSSETPSRLSAVLPAIRASAAALTPSGGQLIFFGSSYPSYGPGAVEPLLPESESKLYDTDKEKTLFTPESIWSELATELAESGVGVELCLSLGSGRFGHIDVKSIGVLATFTGGETRLFPRFDPRRDEDTLKTHLTRILSRSGGYNAHATVRLSKGLRLTKIIGGFVESGLSSSVSQPIQRSETSSVPTIPSTTITTTLAFGTIHADASLAIEYTHTGSGLGTFFSGEKTLDTREYAFIQCAFLYTTNFGPKLKNETDHKASSLSDKGIGGRRVRVLNLALTVGELAGNVFRFADADATVAFLTKETMSDLQQGRSTLANLRDWLTERCSRILLAYRRQCAAATAPTQLILPEAFKLLPLYVLALHKNRSIRAHNVASDLRNYYIHRLLTMPTHVLLRHLYPRFMALHDLTDTIALLGSDSVAKESGEHDIKETLQLPSLMRDTFTGMQADGVYLIDNEEVMVLWVGSSVSPQILLDLFGVESAHDIDPNMPALPCLSSRLSVQVRNILASRREGRFGAERRLLIARQNSDGTELEFSDMLVEDSNCGAMAYVDYLCFVHRQINVALTNNTNIEQISSYGIRGTPW